MESLTSISSSAEMREQAMAKMGNRLENIWKNISGKQWLKCKTGWQTSDKVDARSSVVNKQPISKNQRNTTKDVWERRLKHDD